MIVRITVPATTANLGPGFDILALAIDLCNEVTISFSAPVAGGRSGLSRSPATVTVDAGPDAARDLRDPETNLIATSYLAECERSQVLHDFRGAHFSCVNRIPLARGLGSSAAATVAGVLAAHTLATMVRGAGALRAWDATSVIDGASRIEGHPENVAACVHGGLVICSPGLPPDCTPIDGGLRFVFFVPDAESSTSDARAVVPTSFSRQDAIFNASRCALLVKAMATSNFAMLGSAMDDRWHQPYRAPLLPAFRPVMAAAREAGAYGSCLSGSGSSVLAITSPNAALDVGDAMAWMARSLDVAGSVIVHSVRNSGPAVEFLD